MSSTESASKPKLSIPSAQTLEQATKLSIKLQKAIETTNFDVLKKKEVSETFDGSESSFKNWRKFHSENKNLFFNLGPENNWEKILKSNISKEIEIIFEKEMVELGYL